MPGASEADIERVYRRRYAAFGRALVGVTGDWSLAADAVQDGFARALRYRETFAGGSLEAWLWRIVVRQALAMRPGPVPAEQAVAAFVDPSDGELTDAVRAAVEELPERQRLVVFLRYFADLSYAEIAATCDIAEGTVAATLAKARAHLETALAGRVR
jgi:DNA-directed RNA polymerase specialized sigma24 family protein